jgi:hypothetical protein
MLIAAAALAGCGGGEGAERRLSVDDRGGDERAAAEVAQRYLRAVADRDWAGACATRTRSDREALETLAGSCTAGLRQVFAKRSYAMFGSLRARDVRIRGVVAAVDLVRPGQDEPVLTLSAVREGGRWLLENVPEPKLP